MKTGERIRKLRTDVGLSQKALADKLSVSPQLISYWEVGKNLPTSSDLARVADFFQVTTDYLLGREATVVPVVRAVPTTKTVKIPIIGEVRAGPPLLAIQECDGHIEMPASEVQGGDYFFFRVSGDSMIGEFIAPGSLAYVRQTPQVENGTLAVVLVDKEEATLKRVFYNDGNVTLRAANPEYQDMTYQASEVTIIGEVKWVRSVPSRRGGR